MVAFVAFVQPMNGVVHRSKRTDTIAAHPRVEEKEREQEIRHSEAPSAQIDLKTVREADRCSLLAAVSRGFFPRTQTAVEPYPAAAAGQYRPAAANSRVA